MNCRGTLQAEDVRYGGEGEEMAVQKAHFRLAEAAASWRDSPLPRVAICRHISDQTPEKQSGPGGILQGLLIGKLVLKPGKTLQIRIRVAAEVGDHLIEFAYRQPTRKDHQIILNELKEMLAQWLLRLSSAVQSAPAPIPSSTNLLVPAPPLSQASPSQK